MATARCLASMPSAVAAAVRTVGVCAPVMVFIMPGGPTMRELRTRSYIEIRAGDYDS